MSHRWLFRILAVVLIAGGAVPLTAGASWACSCGGGSFDESQEFRSVAAKEPVVYVAEVIGRSGGATVGADGSIGPGTVTYTLRVTDGLKGPQAPTRTVTTSDQESACGVTLPRRPILVYSDQVSLCGGWTDDRVAQRADIVRAAVAGRPATHVVARGEWLWSIARTELTVQGPSFDRPSDAAVQRAAQRIRRANPAALADPSRLRVGARLTIPRLL